MRDTLNSALKDAMKARETTKVGTLRLINAAIKERDIAERSAGRGELSDSGITELLAKMVKQREESHKVYVDAGRDELAAKEMAEIEIIRTFMPSQMSEDDLAAAIDQAISDTGAASMKDMGKVMGQLKAKFAGQFDGGLASKIVKQKLSS